MPTVFVPLGPNPIVGGHLTNLPERRTFDVDLTVEEGMQAIMATGTTVEERTREETA